jgi:hypothetical protein
MTQLATANTAGNLSEYQARLSVLNHLRQALEASERWDDFLACLEARGLPEARVRQILDVPVPMDLHLHSTCSDGQVPAHKLPWLARVMGLRTIGLADRDSVSGTREFYGEATLLGLSAMPGVELSTGLAGLDILVLFPDAGRFFDFLTTPRGSKFLQYLKDKQDKTHAFTLKVLECVNRWMKRQGIPADRHITVQELDAWHGGQKPFFTTALASLGLARLSASEREKLGLRDARAFAHKVVAAAEKRLVAALGKTDLAAATSDVRKQLNSIRRSRAASVALLSHPKDLVTVAKLSIGQVAKTLEFLTTKAGLDGMEVGGSHDDTADVRIWMELVEDFNGRITRKEITTLGPLLVTGFASDFRSLAPGRSGEAYTLGFGTLDERPEYRRGNLRPQTTPGELLEAMRHRAALRTAEP